MFSEQHAESGGGTRKAGGGNRMRFFALVMGVFLLPVILMAYSSNPPLGLTGAPGEGTCGGCHNPVTAGSGVTVTPAGGLTYTPGGPPVSLVVALTSSGGFELSSRVLNDNSQAGTLTAGTSSGVGTSGSIQYAYQTARAASWNLTWTPPATNVGNVVVYVNGVIGGSTYTNSYTLTPATTAPSETISVSSSALTFAYDGTTTPAGQTVQVTSSGAAIPFTTSVSTSSGGNWLSATPAGGNTPMGATVTASPAGLSVGTYTGTVTVASTGATNSPLTIAITFNVTGTPPPVMPTISSTPSALSFDVSAVGGTATPQMLTVKSSDASALAVSAVAATTTGGSWLSVSPSSSTTPAPFAVSVTTTGLAAGTYHGAVTLTSAGASNSPVTVAVTLTVGTPPPPVTSPVQFSLNVVDKQAGGSDDLLLTGSGAVDSSGNVSGSGQFTRYTPSTTKGGTNHTVSTGSWSAVSVVSYTPASSSSTSGGVLVLKVSLRTSGESATRTSATMRIADTGSDSGVTLTITGGDTFAPTGTGHVSITAPVTGCPAPGGGDSGGTPTPGPPHRHGVDGHGD